MVGMFSDLKARRFPLHERGRDYVNRLMVGHQIASFDSFD